MRVISLDGQPFAFIDRIGTRKLIQSCVEIGFDYILKIDLFNKFRRIDKTWSVEDLPTERTLRRRMVKRAEELKQSKEFGIFIQQMTKNGGCISYDMGDNNGRHFWTIFGHIITDEW